MGRRKLPASTAAGGKRRFPLDAGGGGAGACVVGTPTGSCGTPVTHHINRKVRTAAPLVGQDRGVNYLLHGPGGGGLLVQVGPAQEKAAAAAARANTMVTAIRHSQRADGCASGGGGGSDECKMVCDTFQQLMDGARAAYAARDDVAMDGTGAQNCFVCLSGCSEGSPPCAHCERLACESCMNVCDECRGFFCSFCSKSDYSARFTRVYCFECKAKVGERRHHLAPSDMKLESGHY